MSKRRDISVLILHRDDGRILLQHRDKDAKRLPDYWGFFGGGIENSETPEQALRREIKEELEYTPKSLEKVFEQEFVHNDSPHTKHVFADQYDESQKLVRHEGQDMNWFAISETRDLQMVDHDIEVLQKTKQKLDLR